MKTMKSIDSAAGRIFLAEEDGAITHLLFREDFRIDGYGEGASPLLDEAERQIVEYMSGARKMFDLPLRLSGTDFQRAVWQALQDIPYGETRSYKQVAEEIGNPKAVRAVGMANNRNPVSIIVPCHRVVGSDGALVGYGGGLDVKEKLLKMERENR